MKLFSLFFTFLTLLSFNSYSQTRATFEELQGILAALRCSGAFVDLGQKDSEPAILLTAGHCSTLLDAGDVRGKFILNQNILEQDEYSSYYIWHTPTNQMTMSSFKIKSFFYSVMTDVDVTLLESTVTKGELKKRGIKMFKLGSSLPSVGAKLELTSGLWGQTQSCVVEKILKDNRDEEEIFEGVKLEVEMTNSILLSKSCTARGGWSGSPLFDKKTNLIYGVASRIYQPNTRDRNYVEGDNARVVISNILELKNCLDQNGKLNFRLPYCKLVH